MPSLQDVLKSVLDIADTVGRALPAIKSVTDIAGNVVSAAEGSGVMSPSQSAATSGVMSITTSIISALQTVMPLVGQGEAELNAVKDVIATLEGTGNLTPEQLAALDALDAQCDKAFDDAAKAAGV